MESTGVYLKSLTVKNYLFFNKTTHIDLTVDPRRDKNLVIIGGVNGAGKTTLLQGIKCTIGGLSPIEARSLYSEEPTDDELLFNIAFDWKGGHYRLTRKYSKKDNFYRNSVLEYDNGVEREERRIKDSIDTIFPPNLLDLFFFDVEEVKDVLTQDSVGDEIQQQIERLLGIELVRQARDDAKRLMDDNDTSKFNTSLVTPQIDIIEAEIRHKQQEQGEVLTSIQESQELEEKLERKLDSLPSSVGTQKIKAEIVSKEAEAEQSINRISQLRDDGLRYIKEHMIYELLWPLTSQYSAEDTMQQKSEIEFFDYEKAIEVVRERQLEIEGLGISVEQAKQLIDLLISRDEAQLPELTPSHRLIEKQLKLLQDYGKTAPELKSQLESEVDRHERVKQKLSELRQELTLSQGSSSEREFHEGYLESTRDKLARLHASKQTLEEELKQLRQKYVEAQQQTQEHQTKRTREMLASQFVSVFSLMLDIGRKKLVGRLGDMATKIFRELDNDPELYGEIRFDSVYRPYLQRGGDKWEPINLSQGHQTIFAYSILGALMNLSGFSLPAVIDTPMMKLDRVHKNNVVGKLYPRLSHQVILFSSEEEIDEVYYPRLLPYVNTAYEIKQNSIDTPKGKSKSSYVEKGYFDFTEVSERPGE